MLEQVFDHIKAHEADYLARVMDYVRHPSISAQNIGITEVATLLVRMLADLGMEVEAVPTKGHPIVLGRCGHDPAKTTVLLYGHYDVQPPEPLDEWLSPPFEPTIRDGRIWARGIGDNKGQHFAQLMAIEATGIATPPVQANLAPSDAVVAVDQVQVAFSAGTLTVPVVRRDSLGAGTAFSGPLIVTQLDTTTLVPPGWTGVVHPTGAILLTRQGA